MIRVENFGDDPTPPEKLLRREPIGANFFDNLITIPGAYVFYGDWNLWKTQGSFRGGGLIYGPNDTYGPIVIYMSGRVIGVGSEAFDDGIYPDSAKKNVDTITLEAETRNGRHFEVSECSDLVGDTGFLGVYAEEGLKMAKFRVTSDYFELDHLTVAY